MSRLSKKYFIAAMVALSASFHASAAFVLDGTRYIYEEGRKSIPVNVSNNADKLYGGQVWIDNSNQGNDKVFMVPSPPFFRVDAGQKQLVRIMNVAPSMPADRESLFFLNVQEVPPAAGSEAGNYLAFAMNTKVKLIYRPKVLIDGRMGAEDKVKIERNKDGVFISNPTPYYFAVIALNHNGKPMKLTSAQETELAQFKPFSKVKMSSLPSTSMSFDAINDWGGEQTYHF